MFASAHAFEDQPERPLSNSKRKINMDLTTAILAAMKNRGNSVQDESEIKTAVLSRSGNFKFSDQQFSEAFLKLTDLGLIRSRDNATTGKRGYFSR